MIAYLDSSLVLRNLISGEISIEHVLSQPPVITSELLKIECSRVLQRLRLEGRFEDSQYASMMDALKYLLGSISVIPLSESVKDRAAEAFPAVIGTLDALHLSTALLMKAHSNEEVVMYSHDRQLNICAAACGLKTPLAC